MAIPDSIKLVTAGEMPGGEEWTTSLWLGTQDGPYAGLDLQGLVDDVLEAWRDQLANANWLSNSQSLNTVTGYVYQDGTLVEQAVSAGEAIEGIGNSLLPNQISTVVTLLTATPGRQTRGRMYLPTLKQTTGDQGRNSEAQVLTILNMMGAWLEQVGTSLPLGLRAALAPAVVSQIGAGRRTAITALRVGDVPDTQRRRRQGLVERYTTRSIDIPG